MPGPLVEEMKQNPLLTSEEVAALMRVEPSTVTRWAREGKFRPHGITPVRLPGGSIRIYKSDVAKLTRLLYVNTPEEKK